MSVSNLNSRIFIETIPFYLPHLITLLLKITNEIFNLSLQSLNKLPTYFTIRLHLKDYIDIEKIS